MFDGSSSNSELVLRPNHSYFTSFLSFLKKGEYMRDSCSDLEITMRFMVLERRRQTVLTFRLQVEPLKYHGTKNDTHINVHFQSLLQPEPVLPRCFLITGMHSY